MEPGVMPVVSEPAVAAPKIDWERAEQALAKLIDLLASGEELLAFVVWVEERSLLEGLLGERMASFDQALLDSDLPVALEQLRAMMPAFHAQLNGKLDCFPQRG